MRINQNLPLINPLFIVVKGDKQRSLTNPPVMTDVKNFSEYMMKNSGAVGFQNIVAPLMIMPQKYHEDDPKWIGLADDPATASANLVGLVFAFEPGDMNKFIDPKIMQTNVVVFYNDKTGPTIFGPSKPLKNMSRMQPNSRRAFSTCLQAGSSAQRRQ